jgi:RNA polymerase sigma factor (sigma-70 family)
MGRLAVAGEGTVLPKRSEDIPTCTSARQTVAHLYTTERDDLYRYLVSSGVEPAAAQDVTQEAFLRLYVALRDGADIHTPKGWIYRVAHNLAVDSRLRERRNTVISDPVASALATLENNERDLIERDWLENVRRAIGQLSRQQRACLELRARGLQYSEIAAVLKIRTSTVGEFIRRGIKQLRQWNQCLL